MADTAGYIRADPTELEDLLITRDVMEALTNDQKMFLAGALAAMAAKNESVQADTQAS